MQVESTLVDEEDKSGPSSGRLANVLYTLGLLYPEKGQFFRQLNSREMEDFEECLKGEYSE